MAGTDGLEPSSARVKVWCLTTWLRPKLFQFLKKMVGGGRFELPNPKEQIYSLPRLATSLPSQFNISVVPDKGLEPPTY